MKCSVTACRTATGYMFPRDEIVREKWIAALKKNQAVKTNWLPGKSAVVCKLHFRKEDFKVFPPWNGTNIRNKLVKEAVPSIFSDFAEEKPSETVNKCDSDPLEVPNKDSWPRRAPNILQRGGKKPTTGSEQSNKKDGLQKSASIVILQRGGGKNEQANKKDGLQKSASIVIHPQDIKPTRNLELETMIVDAIPEPCHDMVKMEPPDVDEVMQWVNACQYICQMCGHHFSNADSLKVHVKKSHGCSMIRYKAEFGALQTTTKWLQCQICDTSIMHDLTPVSRHVETMHKMNLAEYYQHFVVRDSKQFKHGLLQASIGTEHRWPKQYRVQCLVCNQWFENYVLVKDHLRSKHDIVGSILKPFIVSSDLVKKWANKCLYKCDICVQSFHSLYPFRRHIDTMGHNKTPITENHVSLVASRPVQHICELCKLIVLQDEEIMTRHVEQKHNMSLPNYFKIFVQIKEMESEQNVLLNYINCYKYTCGICSKVHLTITTLWEHFLDEHNITAQEYVKAYGFYEITKIHYKCPICFMEFDHSEREFGQHLQLKHQANIANCHRQNAANQDHQIKLPNTSTSDCFEPNIISYQTVMSENF